MKKAIQFINNIKQEDRVVHLSHIDSDGYCASYIVNKYLDNKCDLTQLNTNYGEIISVLKDIVDHNTKVIITDLNLTLEECQALDTVTKNWIVVDHHVTGAESAKNYKNKYFLDTTFCATKLIYLVFEMSDLISKYYLKNLVTIIDTYDMWRKENDKVFKKGMLISNYIYNIPFDANVLKLKYSNFIFDKIAPYLITYDVQNTEVKFQEEFLKWLSETSNEDYIKDKDLPSNIKCALMHLPYINEYIVHTTDDYVIFSELTTKITQYVFDKLFDKTEYMDKVLINLNTSNGNVAFRSINAKASTLAILCGGGGHPNAAGTRLSLDKNENYLDKLIKILGE